MNTYNINKLQQNAKRYKQDLENVNKTICDMKFIDHYDELRKEIDDLEERYECESVTYQRLNDLQFNFCCTFIGKCSFVTFEYEDGWICRVTNEHDSPTIISECDTINKFCNDLINSITP
jgi:hypothetical protein